jgi:hypothetical protein
MFLSYVLNLELDLERHTRLFDLTPRLEAFLTVY